ncbi:hypothetical protein COV20_02020 [Candidatus Woesearchaeota archaeon CG10_big_fil_rev_8_21_14_0_10_45_16]|nr:MAG: hypothetical protein COV20_02020 [Candidatus Woesearchaeota archaeon CG10_big_fil_rev_8_21_14_0_10_45_16]
MVSSFLQQIYGQFITLLTAPNSHPDMIWIVLPLLVIITLMIFYFSRYQDEELGWNTALGNSLVLIFVSLDLFRTIFNADSGSMHNFTINVGATIISFLLLLEGFFLLFINFNHILPKRIAFLVSSPLSVNITAYVAIAMIYSQIVIGLTTIIAAILFFLAILSCFALLNLILKRWWRYINRLKSKEKIDDVKKVKKVVQKTKKELKETEKKIKKAAKEEKKEVKQKQKEWKVLEHALHNHRKKKNDNHKNRNRKKR